MIQIITDSTSDITTEEAQKYNITVLPLTVRFGTEEYLDGQTITPKEFYEKMIESDELPKTSQVTPFVYEEAYLKAYNNGDDILVITVSSKLSGCYQSAINASLAFGDRVSIVDSDLATIGEKALVLKAIKLRDEGYSLKEITEKLTEAKKHLHFIALLNTLEYLRKGGRISAAAAIAGMIIGIKPVISFKDGAIEVIGKARGSKTGNNMLIKFVQEHGPINFNEPFCLGYTGNDSHPLDKYKEDSASLYEEFTGEFDITTIGSAIGTYAGPGCIAFAFFDKEENN